MSLDSVSRRVQAVLLGDVTVDEHVTRTGLDDTRDSSQCKVDSRVMWIPRAFIAVSDILNQRRNPHFGRIQQSDVVLRFNPRSPLTCRIT